MQCKYLTEISRIKSYTHTTPLTPSKKHEVDLKSSMYVLEKSGPAILFTHNKVTGSPEE